LDQVTINNIVFHNVAEIHKSANAPLVQFNDVFYFCADAGIIKMRQNHPLDSLTRVLELVRYRIVK
jgi:hypothetical protein